MKGYWGLWALKPLNQSNTSPGIRLPSTGVRHPDFFALSRQWEAQNDLIMV